MHTICECMCACAVSYTHLDVYKRQTRHCAEMVIYVNKRRQEKTKPACVIDYNNKIDVDLSDQRLSYGVFEHRTVKWWRKLAFHILLMCIVNLSLIHI